MADLLPNISVTLNQIKATSGTRRVPINATVLLKAKSGPIGELTKISSYSEAVKIFGLGDATTPALYGIEQYLKTYNYVNIIRVASNQAAKATVDLKVEGEPSGQTVQVYVPVDTAVTPFDPTKTYYVLDEESHVYKVATKKVETFEELDLEATFDSTVTYYQLVDGNYVEAKKTTYTTVEASDEFDENADYYTEAEISGDYVRMKDIDEFGSTTTAENFEARKTQLAEQGMSFAIRTVTNDPLDTAFTDYVEYYYIKVIVEEPITEFEVGVTYYLLEEHEEPVGLGTIITGESVYKTDIYNGDIIKLVYNSTRTRLSISGELNGITYTTPLELIDLSTATADVVEGVLDKLVSNWNALNTGIVLENKFINKTPEDETLTPTTLVSGTLQLGDSGNDNTITNDDVISLFELIEDPTIETQDVVMAPEFRNYSVVNAGTSLENAYFYIVSATGTTLAEKQDATTNYNASDKGVMYIPDSCIMGDTSITVPFEVAALYAWATTYNVNRYYAPAGVKRGVLNLVSNILNNLSDLDAEVLYNMDVPANPVKYLTNYGFTVYGQKTMDASQVFTNRINVSNLVNYIRIQGNIILQPYLFEYTPVSTFQKVYLDLDKMLSSLATQEVLYDDYQIVCDTTNNTVETLANHELHASLAIRPVNVTEYIYLDLTVTDKLGGE